MQLHSTTEKMARKLMTMVAVAGLLALAGCATQPYGYGNRGGYGTAYGGARVGTVQSVRQIYMRGDNDSNILGTIIGAVAGGVLGSTVGNGDGQKAATVAGAVAGGAIGHAVADKDNGGRVAYRVVVRLDDGRMATVTQRQNPGLQRGDRVRVSNDHVYLL
ncbi:MAG TPA: glycine zipper 2TM domain-containing protein [Oleiagrimonas sp.]|nr:glycine zipper 2TM domain-containing protein [Oleiagrimonas sp.]